MLYFLNYILYTVPLVFIIRQLIQRDLNMNHNETEYIIFKKVYFLLNCLFKEKKCIKN